ncbi:MAG: serine protease [Marmoricola sp.]|nr:serine protease [Marmoricola sp.]
MDEFTPSPIPAPDPAEAPAPSPAPAAQGHGKRRAAIAVAGALAIAVAGTGVGYAVGANNVSASSAQRAPRGSASTQVLPPGYGWQGQGGQSFGSEQQMEQQLQQLQQQFEQQFGQQFGQQAPQPGQGFGGQQAPGTQSGTQSGDSTSTASGKQLTGLVRISTSLKYENGEAAGTGLVLTSGGEVVTNHHVVAGATSIKATVMSTGKTYTARLVGADSTADVAVLQLVGASGLDTVTPDTHAVSIGDGVTAVGDGNGTTDHLSAATGKVMATKQSITTQSEGSAAGERLTDLIEISSDVVSGYSGGATYDSDGQVLGMTTAASSGSSDVVGYAIPIATVLKVAGDLEAGVHDSAYTYGYPAFLGVGLDNGTTVGQVYDGTPAAQAGISAGDRITRIDGTATGTETALRAAIAKHAPGDSIKVTWVGTDGSTHSASVTLIQGPVA